MAKGEAKKAMQVAKTSIAIGLDSDTIAKITGLSIDEIEKLRNSL